MAESDNRFVDEEHWQLFRLLPKDSRWRDAIYAETEPYVVEYQGKVRGREIVYPRYSVIVGDCIKSAVIENRTCIEREVQTEDLRPNAKSGLFTYDSLPMISWDLVPNVAMIRDHLEQHISGLKIRICLINLYCGPPDGKYANVGGAHNIGWHSDKEARANPKKGIPERSVYSLSVGATRKFRFRKVGATSGWDYEYQLEDGEMVWMKPGCQTHWEHCVPKELRVKDWRLNFTFRP